MKRRIRALFLPVTALFLLFSLNANADETVTLGDYTYIISDGTAVISSYNGAESAVTVPDSLDYENANYKIRTIGGHAFEGNTYIETLVIPSEITKIEVCAFKNCTGLSSITINGDVGDCSRDSAPSGNYSENYSVFYNVGANADSLTVTFGEGVTYIPGYSDRDRGIRFLQLF